MKLTGSIQFVLVPNDENYSEFKDFQWYLVSYDEEGIAVKVEFDNPIYISNGNIETMHLVFDNTDLFMQP